MNNLQNLELQTTSKDSQMEKQNKSPNYWLTTEEIEALREQSRKDLEYCRQNM